MSCKQKSQSFVFVAGEAGLPGPQGPVGPKGSKGSAGEEKVGPAG